MMDTRQLLSALILVGVMVGLYAADVRKITSPQDLATKIKVPVQKIVCVKGACSFNFQGHSFEDRTDFSWLDLTGADFSKASLTHANFTGAVLTNANFGNAHLEGATFNGADLNGAHFAGTTADIAGHKGNPATMPNQQQAVAQAPMIVAMPATVAASPMPAPTETQVSTAPKTVITVQQTGQPPVQSVAPQSSSAPARPVPNSVPGMPGGGVKN